MRRLFTALLPLLLLGGLLLAGPAHEAHATEPASAGSLDTLGWMVGHWRGETPGALVEEHWTAEAGGAMVGTFRLLRDGEIRFYELILLQDSPAGPVMRIKHFGPDLVGWEDRDQTLDLVLHEQQGTRAVFRHTEREEWLTYHREGDVLSVRLDHGPERERNLAEFRFEAL